MLRGTCCNGQHIRQPPPRSRLPVWLQRALQAQTLQFAAVVRASLSVKAGYDWPTGVGCRRLASQCYGIETDVCSGVPTETHTLEINLWENRRTVTMLQNMRPSAREASKGKPLR